MGDIFHVDTQFLRNALNVFENPVQFEEAARSSDAAVRAGNVATLIDALDLCNLLILGERVVFDTDVGGGREEKILQQIDRIARRFGDSATGDGFRSSFAGVAPANDKIAQTTQLDAARAATAFFPRLARCARNVLDLFHLPHDAPSEPEEHLIRFVESKKQPTLDEIEAVASKKQITGRRFYAALLTDETAFRALCDATTRIVLTTDVLAVLFMNFRLRLAEQRSLAGRVFVGTGTLPANTVGSLTYLPSMGRHLGGEDTASGSAGVLVLGLFACHVPCAKAVGRGANGPFVDIGCSRARGHSPLTTQPENHIGSGHGWISARSSGDAPLRGPGLLIAHAARRVCLRC